MIDLTGDFLLTFLIRELKDVVKQNPRFRRAGGETAAASSSGVSFGDVRITVSSISSAGTRLSPDYFMYTQRGRTVLGKVPNKEGMFIEWIIEDKNSYDPAIHYLYIDEVDEKTRDVKILVRTFAWASGELSTPAQGSYVFFRDGIDTGDLVCSDPTLEFSTLPGSVLLHTLPTTATVGWALSGGATLKPGEDYWVYRQTEAILTPLTSGGSEVLHLPPDMSLGEFILEDNTGYELRVGLDYEAPWSDRVVLGPYTPPGNTVLVKYLSKADPTNPVHPENRILFTGAPVLETCWLRTSSAVYDHSGMTAWNGDHYLKTLLLPGSQLKWDVKVDTGDTPVLASKMASNTNIIDGLTIAIGDKVEVGDEAAIIVYPSPTQTYEVYGTTDNITFTIQVTANDRDTVSDLSAAIKEYFLVKARDRHESCGFTIYDMSSSSTTQERDASHIAPTTTREFSVNAAADWRYYLPLVNRVGDIDISDVQVGYDFPGNMRPTSFGSALGLRSWGPSKPTTPPTPGPTPPTPDPTPSIPPQPPTVQTDLITYGAAMGSLFGFRVSTQGATPITSRDVDSPWVDGVTLQSGGIGDRYGVASIRGATYGTPMDIPGQIGNLLYLGQGGALTTTPPRQATGDGWCVVVGRKVGDRKFIFSPFQPIKLS